jgi:hypothetical protein
VQSLSLPVEPFDEERSLVEALEEQAVGQVGESHFLIQGAHQRNVSSKEV